MNESPLETYLAGQDPVVAPVVIALDHAIRHPDYKVRAKEVLDAARG